MQTISKNASDIINSLASRIVLLEADDIQALGDILKLLDELHADAIKDYVLQVRGIVERLILDEYESASVGMSELNAAIEQLQLAFSETELISDNEFKKKQDELTDDATQADETDLHTIELDDEPVVNITKSEPEPPAKPKAKVEPKVEKKPEPSLKKELSIPKSEVVVDHTHFKNRDDLGLINQTLKDDPELLQGFIDETAEHIQLIENGLIDWESSPKDLTIIDSIFRPFHTIKGVAGFLNLTDINNFSHMYEDVLDDVRKGKLHYSDSLADAIFKGVDALKQMISALISATKTGKYNGHTVDLHKFEIIVHHAKSGGLLQVDEEPEVKTPVLANTPAKPSQEKPAKAPTPTPSSAQDDSEKVIGTRAMASTKDSTLRVSTLKMDSLIDLVGELVVTQNMVVQNNVVKNSSDKRLLQDVGQLKRITSNLQDLSMSLRMIPIKDTFQKMHRIVRDLARKSGKKIVLEVYGEETEIDRNMVDELYDPLVHMIRNNCDHGIEGPDIRKARGKRETGTITLNAYYKGGMVVIEVTDDGNGIDVNYVRKRAIAKGLCKESDKLSEQEVLNFIFASGFSTSETITDVSGRGVGMDVVKRAITNLRGNIEIQTKVGKGTTFTLRLPLTLAIIDGVIVEIGSEKYIIPTVSIKESLVIKKDQLNKIAGKGETVFIRDKVLPLIRVGKHFGISDAVQNPSDGLIIIVESDKQEAALLVDKMIDKQEIVIKSLGESLSKLEGLAGGAILSDGTVGLIVDVPTLLPKSGRSFKDYN
ncbi:chemotaxis protein CheA [bacterium]|nr:MAG: chemotaxis protein CheA [bacterium]